MDPVSDDMIGVPTALEDIEIGHEVEIPGVGRVTVRETTTTQGGPGGTVWTIALMYEDGDGAPGRAATPGHGRADHRQPGR